MGIRKGEMKKRKEVEMRGRMKRVIIREE